MKATPSDATPPPPEPTVPETATAIPPSAPPPSLAKPAQWPEWFGAVDIALGIMVLIVAFLAASFTARNADVWLHLATGRLLAEGNYSPGTDPFTFAPEDRAWADTSWLYSLGTYALYSVDPTGATLVAVKAVLFAVAFGLLALLRKPGHALWPWVVVAAIGVVAAAFYTPVRPTIISVLFQALTLVILFRMPWREGSWREPGLLAGLFALWANLDSWFLLGPLTVLLVVLGEKLNVFMARGEDPIAADDPFPPAPPSKGLLRALWLGVLASLLNPMVWAAVAKDPGEALTQLVPWELGFHTPDGAKDDLELAVMTFKPLSLFDATAHDFLWFRSGQPDEEIRINAVAYFVLAIVAVVSLVVGITRLRATHLLLLIVFLALSLTHVRLIPAFVVVAVPLAAVYLNLLSKRVRLTTWDDLSTRVYLGGSALGRVVCVLGALVMIGAAYPGWLHPPQSEKAFVNRVDWGFESDPGLERTAKELARLRSAGLPAEARGVETSVFFGDLCAWYAPGEKTLTTTRYGLHRNDLPDLLSLRTAMVGRRNQGTAPIDTSDVARICDARGATFLTVMSTQRQVDELGVFQLLGDPRWKLWHLDGRSAIVGRPPLGGQSAYASFLFDPVRIAFAPEVGSLPIDPVRKPNAAPEDGWDSFVLAYLDRPTSPTPDMDDSFVLTRYLAYLVERDYGRTQQRIYLGQVGLTVASAFAADPWLTAGVVVTLPLMGQLTNVYFGQILPSDERMVIPLLSVRAARRAIAANPDRAEAYFALAMAYRQPYVPVGDPDTQFFGLSEQQLQLICALHRYLARVPKPGVATPLQTERALQESLNLSETYRLNGQLDLALTTRKRALGYARLLAPATIWRNNPSLANRPFSDEDAAKVKESYLKFLEGQTDKLEREVDLRITNAQRNVTGPGQEFFNAVRQQVPGHALKVFRETPLDKYGPERDAVIREAIILGFRAGHLEEVAEQLTELEEYIQKVRGQDPRSESARIFRVLQLLRARLDGNTAVVIESLNQVALSELDPAFKRLVADPTWEPIADQAIRKRGALDALIQTGGTPILVVQLWVQAYQILSDEARYHHDRAILDLLDGNPGAARRRFEMALKPQGVDLSRFDDERTPVVKRYLELLRRTDTARR